VRCVDCGKYLNKRGAVRCRYHAQLKLRGAKRLHDPRQIAVTREQVAAGLRQFLLDGGAIQRLSDQVVPLRREAHVLSIMLEFEDLRYLREPVDSDEPAHHAAPGR
jgi:hypothetical protein